MAENEAVMDKVRRVTDLTNIINDYLLDLQIRRFIVEAIFQMTGEKGILEMAKLRDEKGVEYKLTEAQYNLFNMLKDMLEPINRDIEIKLNDIKNRMNLPRGVNISLSKEVIEKGYVSLDAVDKFIKTPAVGATKSLVEYEQ